MNTIILTRKQIQQLADLSNRFEDIEVFTLEAESTSGIGPSVRVRFDLFQKADTNIDITDVSNW